MVLSDAGALSESPTSWQEKSTIETMYEQTYTNHK